jgi:ribosomal protein S18 acetylase RimI-like enzyme
MRVSLLAPQQYESMVTLLCELNVYYNEASPASREAVRDHLVKNLLAFSSPLRLVVATNQDNCVLGFAAIYFVHSLIEPAPEQHRQCVLKELFVGSSTRSQGVGKALMKWVAKFALEEGCCRIDWPVNAANRRGISFYESLGAERLAERLSYRLSSPSLSCLVKEGGCARVGG